MRFPTLEKRLRQALVEDGAFQDITTRQMPDKGRQKTRAELHAKADGRCCGQFLLRPLFSMLDARIRIQSLVKDGGRVRRGQVLARIEGTTRAILGGERTFLNLACHLSGVATLTERYVEAVKGTKSIILDTRKTTPLWRDLEKFAVTCGGAQNHRMSLADAIMVKDNHHRYLTAKNFTVPDVFHIRALHKSLGKKVKFILVEAKTYAEVWEGIKARADIILLDNMSPKMVRGAITFIHAARRALKTATPLIEVSGGITLKQARMFSRMGADRISVGALTHSAPALDLSLEVL